MASASQTAVVHSLEFVQNMNQVFPELLHTGKFIAETHYDDVTDATEHFTRGITLHVHIGPGWLVQVHKVC